MGKGRDTLALNRCVRVELLATPEQTRALLALQPLVTAAYNDAAERAWQDRTIRSATALHHAVYYELRQRYALPAQFVCNVQRLAFANVDVARERMKKGKRACCPHATRLPIPFDARSMSLRHDRKTVTLTVREGPRIELGVRRHRWLRHYADWSAQSGTVQQDRDGRLWLSLTLTKEVNKPKPKGDIVGCDRGIVVPAALSTGKMIGEAHWHRVDRRYFHTVQQLQRKGTTSAKRRLKKRSQKWSRFRTWSDHVTTRRIVEALSQGSTLVLEDLTNIRTRMRRFRRATRRRMHAWSFRRQQQMLAHKAPEQGIFVGYVDPRFTSQRCSACGHTERANRPSQARFVCKRCGHADNADLNAAKNIAATWAATQRNGRSTVASRTRQVNPPHAAHDKDTQSSKVGRGLRVSAAAKQKRSALFCQSPVR